MPIPQRQHTQEGAPASEFPGSFESHEEIGHASQLAAGMHAAAVDGVDTQQPSDPEMGSMGMARGTGAIAPNIAATGSRRSRRLKRIIGHSTSTWTGGFRSIVLALALAALPVLTTCSPAGAPPAPPSFILISLDTVRADYLGVYGDPRGTSPHFDRIARTGSLFARCQAQATATLPSHRSMFRSRTASRSREETPMLAETLRDAGFATVGLTGGGTMAGSLGFNRGFDLWKEDRRGLSWSNSTFAEWLDEAPREKFFALLHTFDAHAPYDAGAYAEFFDPGYTGKVTGPDTRYICRVLRGLDPVGPKGPVSLNDADRRRLIALYRGAIRRTDDLLGDLIASLEARGDMDGAALVLFSDHGEEFWDHGSLLHWHTVYQELAHVPLVIRAPGEASSLVPGVVRLMDVAPTIVELAGLPRVETHEGVSMVPMIRGDAHARSRALPSITEMGDLKSLFETPWKLVTSRKSSAPALYNLEQDPAELRDLAATADSIVESMSKRLSALVSQETVAELSPEPMSPEQHERLKALGYVN
jgi:arylsulfatase A-like enzyme